MNGPRIGVHPAWDAVFLRIGGAIRPGLRFRGELRTVSRSGIPGGGQRFGERLGLVSAALSLGQLFSVVGAKRVTLGAGFGSDSLQFGAQSGQGFVISARPARSAAAIAAVVAAS